MRKIIISAIVIILGIVLLGNISFADTKQQILAKYELEKTAKGKQYIQIADAFVKKYQDDYYACDILVQEYYNCILKGENEKNLDFLAKLNETLENLDTTKLKDKDLENFLKYLEAKVYILYNYITYHNEGSTFYQNEEYEKALQSFEKAKNFISSHYTLYHDMALSLSGLEKYEEALEMQNKVIELNGYKDPSTYGNIGYTLHNLSRYEEAIDMFDKAIGYTNETNRVYFWKAYSLLSLERGEEALNTLEEYANLYNAEFETDYNALNLIGVLLGDLGKPEKSIQYFDKAIALEPDFANLYFNKGMTYYQLGQYKEAYELLNKAVELAPDDQDVIENRDALKAYYLKDVDFMEESIETINQTACEERKLQKGEKNVYMDGDIVENADLNSFQVLNCVFSKDKSNVYFYNYYMGKLQILKGADPKTFQILNSHYVKDDNYVWIVGGSGDIVGKHYLVENINVKSFVALGDSRYAKDKNYVYRQEKLLDFVDVKTFEEVGGGYIKDKNGVYFGDIPFQRWDILEGVDIKTFEVFSDSGYAKDKNHVYQGKELLDFVDVKTFEEVGGNYIKDKNGVYFWSSSLRIWETLEGVDIKNFDYEEYEENKSKIRIEKGVELGEKIEEFRKKFEEKFKACGETDECIIKLQKEFEENEEYKELEREFKEFYGF